MLWNLREYLISSPLVSNRKCETEYTLDLREKTYVVWSDEQIVIGRDPFSSELLGGELVKSLKNR
jgi:hypothetical protein